MQRAIYRTHWGPKDGVPCWLHSVHYDSSFPKACIAINDSAELRLEWVALKDVTIVRRLPANLEDADG